MSDDEEAGVVAPPPPMLQNVPFPPKLEMRGNLANNWKGFKRVWCNYEIASRLIKQGNEERTATLLTCLGPAALEIVDGLNFAAMRSAKIRILLFRNWRHFALVKQMKHMKDTNLIRGIRN